MEIQDKESHVPPKAPPLRKGEEEPCIPTSVKSGGDAARYDILFNLNKHYFNVPCHNDSTLSDKNISRI